MKIPDIPTDRRPVIGDVRRFLELIEDEQPERKYRQQWAQIYFIAWLVSAVLGFFNVAFIIMQIGFLGAHFYHKVRYDRIDLACYETFLKALLMAESIGMSESQVKEMIDELRHKRAHPAVESD